MKLSPEMVTCVSVGKPNVTKKTQGNVWETRRTQGMYGKLEKHRELIMI